MTEFVNFDAQTASPTSEDRVYSYELNQLFGTTTLARPSGNGRIEPYGFNVNGIRLHGIADPWGTLGLPSLPSEYPNTRTDVTASGHVIQYNDTPAGERILFRHRSGSGIDMLPDGSVEISSRGSHLMTVRQDMTVIVSGNLRYQVGGDLDFDVRGNVNFNALNYTSNIQGNRQETVYGNSRSNVRGNRGDITLGNNSTTTGGTSTTTVLGDNNQVTAGASRMTAQGDMLFAGGAGMRISAEGQFDMAADNANMAANSMTVVGATGTMGGAGIHFYGYNAHIQNTVYGQSMQANTFHGDLAGTAQDALEARVSGALGPVTIGGFTNTAVDGTTTALPNGDNITDYLTLSERGIINVDINQGGEITNMINLSVFNGGLSQNELDPDGVRSILQDPANRENSTFTGNHVAAGNLSPRFRNPVPGQVNGAAGNSPGAWPTGGRGSSGFIIPSETPSRRTFMPPARLFITDLTEVTNSLELMPGIRLSDFMSRANINNVRDPGTRQQIARNLQLHAWYLSIVNNSNIFNQQNYSFRVWRGLYAPGPGETPTPNGVNSLAMDGRAVIYELVMRSTGGQDVYNTYQLARYLKDFLPYDELILNYDEYSPDGELSVYITIKTPIIPIGYLNVTYANEVSTTYNGETQSNELLYLGANATELDPDDTLGISSGNHRLGAGLNADLVGVLEAAAAETGVTMVTTSGRAGRENSNSGRHNDGDASDTSLYINGRLLSVGNPQDRLRIIAFTRAFLRISRERGFSPSVGWADHTAPRSQWYMSGTSGHFDIAGTPGRGNINRRYGTPVAAGYWGNGENGAGAPAWLHEIFNNP